MMHIKNIIFDLGGVLINLDYDKTAVAFKKLGVENFDDLYTQFNANELFEDIETGKISDQDFYATISKYCSPGTTQQQMETAWNAMLLDIPLRRLQILQQLQLHFDMFLLSNTNEIHEEAFNEILRSQCGFKSMGVFFDKVYYSHRVGMRKPDKEIFQLILDQNSLNPEKTLFIDDSPQHIEGAKKVGLHTLLMTEKPANLESFLKSNGIL